MGRDNLLPRGGFNMTQANDLNKSPFKKLKRKRSQEGTVGSA